MRVTGIEPVSQPWKGYMLPLQQTRLRLPKGSRSTNFEARVSCTHVAGVARRLRLPLPTGRGNPRVLTAKLEPLEIRSDFF